MAFENIIFEKAGQVGKITLKLSHELHELYE